MGSSQSRSRSLGEGPPKHGKPAPRSMGPQTGAPGHMAAPAPGPRGAARACQKGSRVDQLQKKAPPPGGYMCASPRATGPWCARARPPARLVRTCDDIRPTRVVIAPCKRRGCARAPQTSAAMHTRGWSRRMAALSDFRSPGQVRTPVASSGAYHSQNLATALSFDPRSPGTPYSLSPSPLSSASLLARSLALSLHKLSLAPADCGCGRTDANPPRRSGKGVGHQRKGIIYL